MHKLGLILLANVLSFIVVAQKIKTNEIVVNTDSTNIRVEVTQVPVEIKTKSGMTYHWYKANAIHSSIDGYDGKLLHGNYTAFYPSNNIKEKGMFTKGLKDGEWKAWNDKGELLSETNYKSGLKNGSSKMYDSSGKLMTQEEYKKGKLVQDKPTEDEKKEEVKQMPEDSAFETAPEKEKKGLKLFKKKQKEIPQAKTEE